MFDEQQLDSFVDEKTHIEYDNIKLRKLFRILILPARYGDPPLKDK